MTSTIPILVAREAESTGTITAPIGCKPGLVPNGLLIQNAAENDNADPACFPSGYTQYGRVRASVVYSPGYCPHGYTSADLVIHKPATTAVCCPSDFTYYQEKRDLQTTFAGCLSELPSSSSTIVTVHQVDEESTQVSGPMTMWAQAIQVELQASDKSLFVSTTTTTATTDTKTSTSSTQTGLTVPAVPDIPEPAAPSPAAPSPAAPDTGTEPSGLSTGAKIGVGVGVGAAGLIVLVALLFWFFRRRQQKGQEAIPDTTSSYGSHPEVSELGESTQADPNMLYQCPGHGTPSEPSGSSQAGRSSIVVNTRTTGPSELHATNASPKFVHELGA
ncbi:hypothetical protein N7463_000083 [Penicillium fimorum]|uniref:LPXTG-motif cell wall anchor n=1 Tax=Penicillium fimorum TaxID=1882269 RepID=A0A9W9Y3K5_9EURO|nr:hypothetical protein N7463_000083 [Penicillium fimorum]